MKPAPPVTRARIAPKPPPWGRVAQGAWVLLALLVLGACSPGNGEVNSRRVTTERPTPKPTADPTPDPTADPLPEPEPAEPQVRGMWVHLFTDELKTRAGIDRVLDDAVRAGVNTVIAQVIRRHDAYYDSRVLPGTADPNLEAGLDVLDHLTTGARERGLSVHAWFAATPTYHHVYNDLPRPPGWVWAERGPDAPEDRRWVTRTHDGRWGEYLDPGVPAVREHIAQIAADLARYDIDAVHADYLRYPNEGSGYHPEALARFHAETGRSDVPAPTDPQWSDWRRMQTRALAAEVRQAIAEVDPSVGLSAALYSAGEGPGPGRPFTATRPYHEVFQDWPGWVRDGLVDAAFPMAYFDEARYPAWYTSWLAYHAELALEVDAVVAIGIGAWLNTAEAGESQLARALDVTNGAVVYSYQQNANTEPHDALLERLGRGLWADPAPPPPLR